MAAYILPARRYASAVLARPMARRLYVRLLVTSRSSIKIVQEAQLSPRDRAMRRVS